MIGAPDGSTRTTATPGTAAPAPVVRVPDKLVAHALSGVAARLIVCTTGSNCETTEPAVVLPVAVAVNDPMPSCVGCSTVAFGHAISGRRHSSGDPPIALIRALTSPSVWRPEKVIVNVGCCPVAEVAKVERSTVFVPGTATFVQAVIGTPAESLTVSVAEVYTDVVVTVKLRHA